MQEKGTTFFGAVKESFKSLIGWPKDIGAEFRAVLDEIQNEMDVRVIVSRISPIMDKMKTAKTSEAIEISKILVTEQQEFLSFCFRAKIILWIFVEIFNG